MLLDCDTFTEEQNKKTNKQTNIKPTERLNHLQQTKFPDLFSCG